LPEFDVIHQGMGPDGHTASLFPGDPRIDDRKGIAAALWVEKMKQWRITLLPGVLLSARSTAMLVTGADKAPALEAVLNGPYEPREFPSRIMAREGRDVNWFLATDGHS
jgi:6-phosphogluconolactonase